MSTALLITPPASESVASLAASARAQRDALLAEAGTVSVVADRLDADAAVSVLRSLKAFLTEIESQREAVKAPILKIGRDIDALAKELVSTVKTEESRIARLCGAFEAEERRKAEEKRRQAEIDAARIAYEAAAATRKAITTAPNQETGLRAADAIAGQAQTKIAEVKQAAVAAQAPKQAASQLRTEVCFEVTDIKALYAAEPNLVTLEPNGSAIRAILKANPNLVLPGLRHWTEEKLNVR